VKTWDKRQNKRIVIVPLILLITLLALSVGCGASSGLSSKEQAQNVEKLNIALNYEFYLFERFYSETTYLKAAKDVIHYIDMLKDREEKGELPKLSESSKEGTYAEITRQFWEATELLLNYMNKYTISDNTWPTAESVQSASALHERFKSRFNEVFNLMDNYVKEHGEPGFDGQQLFEEEEKVYSDYVKPSEIERWMDWTDQVQNSNPNVPKFFFDQAE